MKDIIDRLMPSKQAWKDDPYRNRGVYRSSTLTTSVNTPLPVESMMCSGGMVPGSGLCLSCCDGCDTVSFSESESSQETMGTRNREFGRISQFKLRPSDSYSQWDDYNQVGIVKHDQMADVCR